MNWLYLSIAIITEVIATSALKASEGFTVLIPSILVIVGYGLSFYFLALTLKTLPVAIVYSIWSGVGIALISLIGFIIFKQSLDGPALAGIGLIAAGVVVINTMSNSLTP